MPLHKLQYLTHDPLVDFRFPRLPEAQRITADMIAMLKINGGNPQGAAAEMEPS